MFYYKAKKAKLMGLSLAEIVSLKLYTDFDALQREVRKCFRAEIIYERRERQKSFYFWYDQLKNGIGKSQDIITQKIYHGVDVELPPSTFFGHYHGLFFCLYDLHESIFCVFIFEQDLYQPQRVRISH